MYWSKVLIALQLFLVNCLIESASDQNLQRYLPLSEDEAVSTNQRFQQIMQSGSPSDIAWKQPKLKVEKVDVKAEIGKLNSTYVYQSEWPDPEIKLGAVTAVAFDKAGNVVIFHRVNRIWSQTTFDQKNVYTERYRGPIEESTVVAFDRKTGKVVYDWGKNMFYMPHGLTIDKEDNVWVTDVGLHQVMKFGPRGASADKPLLKLGTAFSPGNSDTKFCKPTSVAVLSNGDFFVADGYCNGRIVKYSASGEKILQWGHNSFSGEVYEYAPKNFFAIPHALTLVPDQGLVCTADRENGRVQCFYSNNGTFHSQYHSQIIGDRLFSMDYTPSEGGQLVVVNGPTGGLGHPDHYNEVRGYVLNMKSKQVMSKFGPNDLQFSNPHDVAITEDGNEIYVAELDPTKVHKFLHKKVARSLPMSAAKPTATSVESSADEQQQSQATTKVQPGSTALLVAVLMIIFALLTFGMALLISRRRKRGCFPFGVKNRRHAWDFPSKPEGFKLTGLLDHRKRGFEKLDQNASDEEPDVTTNMLASAQFA